MERFMLEALKQAEIAKNKDEVPVGCVIVRNTDNEIIARGYNQRISKSDATMHAEIVAIRKACKKQKDWRLDDCTIYVTLEPCPMCASAIKQARINNVFCGLTSFDNVSHLLLSYILMSVFIMCFLYSVFMHSFNILIC